MTDQDNSRTGYVALVVVAIVAIALAFFFNKSEDGSSRLGEAAEEVGDGMENAAQKLDPHRTPGEKFGDAVEDMGENIQDATHN